MIVILAWGSLIWAPGGLSPMLAGDWQADGPFLPVEYCRQSKDGRLTLVVTEQAPSLRVLWSATTAADIDVAIRELP